MRWNRDAGIGLAACLLFVILIVGFELPWVWQVGHPMLHVHALFNDVLGLRPDAPVTLGGVRVGYVEKLDLRTDLAKVDVTLALEEPLAVKTDSKAKIGFDGQLQPDHLELSSGSTSSPVVEPGTYLSTQEQVDPQGLLAALDRALAGIGALGSGLSPDKVHALIGPLGDFFRTNQANLGANLLAARLITAAMAEGRGSVGRLLTDDALLHDLAVTLMRRMQLASDQLRGLSGDARETMAGPRLDRGTIGAALYDRGELYTQTVETLRLLDQILAKLNSGQGTAGKLLNDDTVYLQVRRTLPKMEKAVESVEDQGPMSALGIAAGKLKSATAQP
ncbi:MAG: putative phospholipid transporter-binding protein MlaD [Verrucomicrobiota bacterium]